MGVVYRVFDREDEIEVALKTVGDLRRLKGEFRAQDLGHPNLVRVYDLKISAEHFFFTMELVEGSSLLHHLRAVDGPAPFDDEGLTRLRDAMSQLVSGLEELHAHAVVHRDIKPSNVLVTPAGRVVLLDFGLAAPIDSEATRAGLTGTPPYMSPEQMTGLAPTPASDWFSVGVVLYRLLTGLMPFGPRDPLRSDRPRPSAKVAGVPAALDEVTRALLHPEPDQRIGGQDLLEALDAPWGTTATHPKKEAAAAVALRTPTLFVGRRDDLEMLDRHLRMVMAGTSAVVRIQGESGIGKTTLMRNFLEPLEREERIPILKARCHPREAVPFRAVDPLVDALCRYLCVLEERKLGPVPVPSFTSRLLELFPVLEEVEALKFAKAETLHQGTAQESEREALWALREILVRLSLGRRQGAVILWIDDAQWGDIGSARVLEALLSPQILRIEDVTAGEADNVASSSNAPRRAISGRFLVVLTYRQEIAGDASRRPDPESDFLARIERAATRLAGMRRLDDGHRELELPAPRELGPLGDQDIAKVVDAVFPRSRPERLHDIRQIAEETGGSPFLLHELSNQLRFALSTGQPGVAAFNLDDAIQRRLPPPGTKARVLTTLVAISGRPLERILALELAGIDAGGGALVADLCARSILKLVTSEKLDALEIYHDQIRESVLKNIEETELQNGHEHLADALKSRLPEPMRLFLDGDEAEPSKDLTAEMSETVRLAALVGHLHRAGKTASAARAADLGAWVAGKMLQFDREAELLDFAVKQLGEGSPGAWKLLARRGEALANAGRGREAGEVLIRATKVLEEQSPPQLVEERRRLLSRAGTQYLFAGYLNEGREALRTVLGNLDIPVPTSMEAARRSSLRMRLSLYLRLRLRGYRFPDQPGKALSELKELRLKTAHDAFSGLSMLDFTLSDSIALWHLLEAIRLDADARIPSALALEASVEAAIGGQGLWRHSKRLLDKAQQMAKGRKPFDRATVLCCRSSLYYYQGHWDEAITAAKQSIDELKNCPEETHGLAITNAYLLSAMVFKGELRELAPLRDEILDDARRRNDVLTQNVMQSAEFVLIRLARDQPDVALREADATLESFVADHFTSQNYYHVVATVKAHLYKGQGMAAWEQVDDERWNAVKEARFLSLVFIGTHLRYVRACAALAAAQTIAEASSDRSDSIRQRTHLLALAKNERREIARAPLDLAEALAQAIDAGIAQQNGEDARPLLESARAGFADCKMQLHERAAAIVLARLRGGVDQAAEQWMRDQDVLYPLRMARTAVPVFLSE
jgi:tetratricopeptide (TPR) repeat protein